MQMGFIPENSLAGKMWGSISEGLDSLSSSINELTGQQDAVADKEEKSPEANASPDQKYADLDARAKVGDINFQDFLTMSETFLKMGDNMGALPAQMSAKEVIETREKFVKHEKIVEIMLEDEKLNPQLLIDDLQAGGSTPGPRIQRLASGSGESEGDVALFIMQFEAMRESTRRIAAGEDPDEVDRSMSTPAGANRAARRNAKKSKAKKQKQKR